jgi:hypothetical protein
VQCQQFILHFPAQRALPAMHPAKPETVLPSCPCGASVGWHRTKDEYGRARYVALLPGMAVLACEGDKGDPGQGGRRRSFCGLRWVNSPFLRDGQIEPIWSWRGDTAGPDGGDRRVLMRGLSDENWLSDERGLRRE